MDVYSSAIYVPLVSLKKNPKKQNMMHKIPGVCSRGTICLYPSFLPIDFKITVN